MILLCPVFVFPILSVAAGEFHRSNPMGIEQNDIVRIELSSRTERNASNKIQNRRGRGRNMRAFHIRGRRRERREER